LFPKGSGCVDKAEFKVAAASLGIELKEEEVDSVFEEFDADKSGTVDQEEFVRFCVSTAQKRSKGATLPEGTDTSTVAHALSPEQAQHGFQLAHMILDKNPHACKTPMGTTPPLGATGARSSPWLPLHYVLTLDCAQYARGEKGASSAAAADAAFKAAAEPLIVRLCKLHPDSCKARVMEGVRFQLGSLPAEFAIARGWGAVAVKAILEAYPQAATLLDPTANKKKFDPKTYSQPTSLKGARWLRKIGEEARPPASAEVLRLLPRPSKEIPPKWTSGVQVEEEEAEKLRKKKEKEAAAEAKAKAKTAKKAANAAKAAGKAAKQAAKESSSSGAA